MWRTEQLPSLSSGLEKWKTHHWNDAKIKTFGSKETKWNQVALPHLAAVIYIIAAASNQGANKLTDPNLVRKKKRGGGGGEFGLFCPVLHYQELTRDFNDIKEEMDEGEMS